MPPWRRRVYTRTRSQTRSAFTRVYAAPRRRVYTLEDRERTAFPGRAARQSAAVSDIPPDPTTHNIDYSPRIPRRTRSAVARPDGRDAARRHRRGMYPRAPTRAAARLCGRVDVSCERVGALSRRSHRRAASIVVRRRKPARRPIQTRPGGRAPRRGRKDVARRRRHDAMATASSDALSSEAGWLDMPASSP